MPWLSGRALLGSDAAAASVLTWACRQVLSESWPQCASTEIQRGSWATVHAACVSRKTSLHNVPF